MRFAKVVGMAKTTPGDVTANGLVDRREVGILNIGSGTRKPMGRTLSLLARLPRTEADGVTPAIDSYRLAQAARSGDYPSFRGMLLVFEEPLRRRLGQRHPEVEAHLGEALRIDDIVEEVFLQAFEGFCTRPHEVAPGDWLESLIDPAVRALSEELDNLSFVRSLREVEPRAPWSRCRASRPRPSTW